VTLILGELATILTVDDDEFKRDLDKAEGRFRGFGGRLKAAALAAGAVAGAALAAGVVQTLELGAANDKLAAQLGSTPAEAKRLGEIAGDLYAGAWGESMPQVNEAIRSVVQNIDGMRGASDEALHDITASAIDLGTTFDQDIGQTSRAAGKLIKTGLAKDATEALDLLTRGFQTGANEADDLLETVSEYSTMFRDLGLDGQQAFGLVSQGLEAGARDADTVADAIKEFAIRAQDGSELSAAGFKTLGLSAKDMTAAVAAGGPAAEQALGTTLDRLREIEDPAKRNAAAVALFGTKAEDLGDALFALDLDTAADQLGTVDGAAARMGETLNDNAKVQLESLKRQVQQVLIDKMAAAVPHLQAVGTWMAKHKAIVVPLVGVLGTFAVAVGAVTVATKLWHGVMMLVNAASKAHLLWAGLVKGATVAWTVVQWLLNFALTANPIGLLILAIVILIGIIVLIATKTTWFQTLWKHAWGAIRGSALAVGRWFRDTLWRQWIVGTFNGIIATGGRAVDWFRKLPGKVARSLVNIGSIISAPWRWGFNQIASFWNRTAGRLSFRLPDWVPGMGGRGFSMPTIPLLARGARILGGGLAVVGEDGPEVVHLGAGARVAPLDRTVPVPAGGGTRIIRILLRGDGILRGLRDEVQVQGGNVQLVLGG
jgi:phage-related minor tail protein